MVKIANLNVTYMFYHTRTHKAATKVTSGILKVRGICAAGGRDGGPPASPAPQEATQSASSCPDSQL